MYAVDPDALLCDMAQTYGVFGFESLPASTLAVLAAGLPEDCRVKRRLSGAKVDDLTLLLSMIVDRLGQLVWLHTEDARHGRNRPESLVEKLTAEKAPREGSGELEVFEDGDAFMTARAIAIMRGE